MPDLHKYWGFSTSLNDTLRPPPRGSRLSRSHTGTRAPQYSRSAGAARAKLARTKLGNFLQPLKTMRGRLIAVIVAVLAVAFTVTLMASYRMT